MNAWNTVRCKAPALALPMFASIFALACVAYAVWTIYRLIGTIQMLTK